MDQYNSTRSTVLLIIISFFCHPVLSQNEDFNILNKWIKWSNSGSMLISHINDQALQYLKIRGKEIVTLKTESERIKR